LLDLRQTNFTDLSAFRHATGITRLYLDGNQVLKTLDGLASAQLRTVGLYRNSELTDLGALSGLVSVDELSSNPRLELGSSFFALRRLTAYTTIDADGIVGRAEFPRLETASGLQISANTALSELQLPVLRECQYLTVQNSPQLTALQPWEGDGVCDSCPIEGVVGIGISCPFWLCASGTDTTDCNSPDAGR
jgi:hypothetical protein